MSIVADTGMPVYDRSPTRPLKIYAIDPMLGRAAGRSLTLDIENEVLQPGPQGERLEVVDYDGAHQRYYPPVDLDDANILMRGGMEPSEADPRFHQQMVYAVAMRTLRNFDQALGRRIKFHRSKQLTRLRLVPHAFYGANAFYDRDSHAIVFGYFRADKDNPGDNLPGQTIFTCLSHDIIAHEMTHAIVDRLRPYFMEPSNEDVLAFHEGIADVVALFQKFSYSALVREQLQLSHVDVRSPSLLNDLAAQFGYATGSGRALRTAIDKPDPKAYQTQMEPHRRGSILVSAVFDAFCATYERRTRDLIRIATGGSGRLPEGELLPDLIGRLANEASKSAQQVLSMCIRAFDYLPPVDITFGDYLRALVTADYELSPGDEWGTRAALIEAFRVRGVYASQVPSLAEESLRWEPAATGLPPLDQLDPEVLLSEFVDAATRISRERRQSTAPGSGATSSRYRVADDDEDASAESVDSVDAIQTSKRPSRRLAAGLQEYAKKFRGLLDLEATLDIEVAGFHTAFRVSPTGQLLIELIVQFAQRIEASDPSLGGLPMRGGTTIIAAADGAIRYVISKPLPHAGLDPAALAAAEHRVHRQRSFVGVCDAMDLTNAYENCDDPKRMQRRMSLRSLHEGF